MKRSCFTLIELLVVIAIIIILLAIILPVLGRMRQKARALKCVTHIRQITLDLLLYDNDHETFPFCFRDAIKPPPGGLIGNTIRDRMGWWWFHFMEGYIDTKKKVLYCPSKSLNDPSLKDSILYGNYGVNRSICKSPDVTQNQKEFSGASLSKDEIPRPNSTLLIVDCGYSITSWWHAADISPVPLDGNKGEDTAYVPGLAINKDKHFLPGQRQDAIDGRHPNKTVTVGFVGLNVTAKQADELSVEKGFAGYKNRIPLWSPE
jgi:hypothetical protein